MKNKSHEAGDTSLWCNPVMAIKYLVCVLLFSCFVRNISAQNISVTASIDRNNILIGEPIRLQLEVKLPAGTIASWFPLDSLAHFEFVEKARIDTVDHRDERSFRQIVTITSFDSGRWVIPSLALDVNGRYYLTDSLPVSVAFSNFDASQEYHDIKDILEVGIPDTRYITWSLLAFTILCLLAVIYFLRKRAVQVIAKEPEPTSNLTPYEEAIKMLEKLRAEQLPENGQVKLYYTRMNDILRSFILRKTMLSAMQKTNEELMLQVHKMGIQNDTFVSMAQTLRMSDAVKFAKFIPGPDDNEQSFRNIRASIESLNNIKTGAL